MELRLNVVLACICGLFFFQCISCEDPIEGLSTLNWRCICAAGPEGAVSYTPASNCSSSCNCMPDESGGSDSTAGWNCSCVSNGASHPFRNIHDTSCFTSCNCTSGSPTTPATAEKHSSNKGVIVILVFCVVLITIGFLVSLACYFCRKDKFSRQLPIVSSDKETSWNSSANLISHRSASFQEWQVKSNPHIGFTAFLRRLLLMFGSERGIFPGAIIHFSFVELEQATEKFAESNLIGLGGSSNVYRGQLKDGRVVAIKKLKLLGGAEEDYVFLSEIELISRLNHCHVVPLLGYCSEYHGKQCERLLVFEFMPNGNLRDCLDATLGKEPMDWATRVGIALGAARGLEYLHEAAAPRILHRDIKSTNILLDDKYTAKITDLGMAKLLVNDDLASCSSSPARMLGTFGYFAPEYAIVGKASLKSDVFSFGVVILELISGRQPIHKSSNRSESLVIWAAARLRDSKSVVTELSDPLLQGNFPEEEMQIMAHLARECLQWDPDSRPTMSEVVQILSTIAPGKSKRKHFPAGLFMSPPRSCKYFSDIERKKFPVEKPLIGQAALDRIHARWSLPVAVERNLCEDKHKNFADMERLVLLTSPSRSWQSSDEETVDLTEPRFESFMQVNIQSL